MTPRARKVESAAALDAETARRFDRNGPRYTSYPTADRFVESYGPARYREWAARRNTGGIDRSLGLYLHLPFCRDVCYYCACNRIVTRDAAKGAEYLRYLEKELTLQAALFRGDPLLTEMHWGGGTPTWYTVDTLAGLRELIGRRFEVAPEAECSIEVDPRTVDAAAMKGLREAGFNRVSFGVQDFDENVQAAIHRPQSAGQTSEAIAGARRAGFRSVNVDLVYGLPRQTLASFESTLVRLVAERPDRVALYNYAHLPAVFAQQRGIRDADLPSAELRVELFGLAAGRLDEAGYVAIGMDHFALPEDELAVAQRRGRLRRGFQGYTGRDCDVVGLGVSAIGSIGPTYSQNFRDLKEYYGRLDLDVLPIMRGYELNMDDLLRRAVIQSLMCQFAVGKGSVEVGYLVDFDRYFAAEIEALRDFERAGLVTMDDRWLTVTARGRGVIRAICMVFDRHLRSKGSARRYSRVV